MVTFIFIIILDVCYKWLYFQVDDLSLKLDTNTYYKIYFTISLILLVDYFFFIDNLDYGLDINKIIRMFASTFFLF